MIQFGQPLIWVNPNAGNLATNPTPMQPLTGQNFEFNIAQDIKELRGLYKSPDDAAPGDAKYTGKFEFGRPDLDLFNQMMFADVRSTGGPQTVWNEAHNVPASTPYTITVNQSTAFDKDLGVKYAGAPPAVSGATLPQQLTRVATSPAQGQYSVSAGVYTFAAADAGAAVVISYDYTVTAGFQTQINQQLMGYGPQVELWIANMYQKSPNSLIPGIRLYAVKFSKLGMPFKRDGYELITAEYTA